LSKTCFDCGIKGESLTGPIFSSEDKLREFYFHLGVSDPIIEKMQTGDVLCSKCVGKAECRHAIKCYEYYRDKWTPEQYEIWAKSNSNLISIAEIELKKQEHVDVVAHIPDSDGNMSNESKINLEKLAIINGNSLKNGISDSTGQAIINSELATKFEAFCEGHKGKIIDWNMGQQCQSDNWSIFIRYFE
jgi:hypothetical protein